ncbi:hypothetical protein [Rhizobium sp. SG2393]
MTTMLIALLSMGMFFAMLFATLRALKAEGENEMSHRLLSDR